MNLKLLITVLFIFVAKLTFGQTDSSLIVQKPVFVINADFRQSFVKSSPITIYGGYAGLKFKQKHLFSLGYYTLSEVTKQTYKAKNQQAAIPVNDDVSLWFASLGYTRTLFRSKRLKVDIPAEVGIGDGSVEIYSDAGKTIKLSDGMIIPLQIGVSGIVSFTPWLGVHLQAGYREMLGKSIFNNEYSGIYYTYGITLNFGHIYRHLKSKG